MLLILPLEHQGFDKNGSLEEKVQKKHEQLVTDMYCVYRVTTLLQVMVANHQRFPGLDARTCCWQLPAKPRLQLFTQLTHVTLLNLSCPRYGPGIA